MIRLGEPLNQGRKKSGRDFDPVWLDFSKLNENGEKRQEDCGIKRMNYFGKVNIHMAMSSSQLDICDLIVGKKPGLEIRRETHQNTGNSSSHEDNSHL